MNKLNLLLKVHLLNSFGVNRALHSRDPREKRKMLSFGILMIFVAASLLFTSYLYSAILADSFEAMNAMGLLLGLMMAVSSLIVFFTTIYKVSSILFTYRDYDQILSLPIPERTVVASRVLILYGMNIAFCLVVMLPAAAVYCQRVSPAFAFYPVFLVTLLLMPLPPIILATIVGAVISLISSRFRRSNLISLLLALAAFCGAMLLSMNMGSMSEAQFEQLGSQLTGMADRIYPLTGLYMRAVDGLDAASLLLFCGIAAAGFGLFVFVVAKFYRRLNTLLRARRTVSHFRLTEQKTSSPFMALYKKELRRYFSSSVYVLNTAVGGIMLVIFSLALLFAGTDTLGELLEIPGFDELLAAVAPLIVSVLAAMSCTTACSISLEGQSLWIIKSLPVSPRSVLWSKAAVNLTVLLPCIAVGSGILCAVLKPDPIGCLFLFLTPAAYSVFTALFGLVLNLLFPNFTWTNETAVIKQSVGTLVALLGGMLSAIAPIVLYFNLPGVAPALFLAGTTAVVAAISAGLFCFLRTRGAKMFAAL